MNSPEENAVTDLGQFTSNVLNGLLDMHPTAAALIRYSFSVRTVKDVVRRGTENAELVNQIADSLNHLVIYLNEEIVVYASKANQAGLENRQFTELSKRMQLLHEVWLAMACHEAYMDRELVKHVEASRDAVKCSYELSKDFARWKELTPQLQHFFLGVAPEDTDSVKPDEPLEPTLFAREDGVVTSLAHEQALSDEDAKKKQFVAKTEKVLNNYRAKNPNFKAMNELIGAKTSFRLDGIHSDGLIDEIIDVWDLAIEYQTNNPTEKYVFTALLKKIFLLMSDKRRNGLASKLFDKYKNDCDDVLPCLENFIENFQSGLTESLNRLPLDASVMSNKPDALDGVKDQLMWYLLVSPVYTLQQCVSICIDNKGYAPLIHRICRALPTLFDRSVHVTPLPFETADKKDKLLVTILHRIFMIGRTTWTTAAQWENAGFVAMSFAKTRKRKEGDGSDEAALLDVFSLIQFALSELPKEHRKPLKAVETLVRMLQRLLANNNNARMLANFRFANSFTDTGDCVIPTPIVMHLMFELLLEFDGTSSEVCDGAREVLKSIGGRMETDRVVFDADTSRHLTDEVFNAAPWWLKYSIGTWFASSLAPKTKRQVPSGVFLTVPEDVRDEMFEQIKSEEVSLASECYLRSLFELGLFDVDLAIDLLKIGQESKFGATDVVEKMALALVDSYGKRVARRKGGLDIGRLIKQMLSTFDPIRELVPLKSYNDSYFESIRKIEHILVLFMATRIAKEKQISAASMGKDCVRHAAYDELLSANEVAEQLMDVFCETTKAHVDAEVGDVAKLREEANKLIFTTPGVSEEKWKIMTEKDEREHQLVLQLTMLYLKASHFTRLYSIVPVKLQQLMNVTLDKQFDSQKLVAKKVMDDVLTEQRKTEVVYAFVDPTPPVAAEQDAVQPVKPSELVPPPPATSAENAMFNMNNPDHYYNNRRSGGSYRGGGGRKPLPHQNYHEYSDRPTSSSSSPANMPPRNRNVQPYRGAGNGGKKWAPVADTHSFSPREREFLHAKASGGGRYSQSDFHQQQQRRQQQQPQYEHETLYFDRNNSPSYPNVGYEEWDTSSVSSPHQPQRQHQHQQHQRRWASESDYDEAERFRDKTLRSLHSFAGRDAYGGGSPPPPQQGQEGKGKKGFEHNNTGQRMYRPHAGSDVRKQRFAGGGYDVEQEEEMRRRVKSEELAQVMGYGPDRFQPPKPRRNYH